MKNTKNEVAIILIVLIAALIAFVVIYSMNKCSKTESIPEPAKIEETAAPERTPVILDAVTDINVETVEEGLRDMGFLITQEYFFTDAVSNSKSFQISNIKLGFTQSSYVGLYDGEVTAGIDFTRISVSKSGKELIVTLPQAEIKNIDIDPDSFRVVSEKSGVFTRISADDYNASLSELENTARERALEIGILEKANDNAKLIIENFIMAFDGADGYNLEINFE